MYTIGLDEYRALLAQCLEPERRHLATPEIAGALLAKSLTPGHARGHVEAAALELARQELAGMVGKVPSPEIARREAEINQAAAVLEANRRAAAPRRVS